jgi:hypothetical protein
VWILLPIVAVVLGLRSCARSPGTERALQLRTRFDEHAPAALGGPLDDATRAELRVKARALGMVTLIPLRPAALPVLHGTGHVIITESTPDAELVFTYVIEGRGPNPALLLTISPLDRVCTEQSAIQWQQPVPIRSSTGCLAPNPGASGGVFLEWVEDGHSLHVEAASPDADAVLAWLGSWVPA